MAVSNEVRSKVIAITGMEPVCNVSTYTVKEHIYSTLYDIWMYRSSGMLMQLQARILQGSMQWCEWSDDDYKSLFDEIHGVLGTKRLNVIKDK